MIQPKHRHEQNREVATGSSLAVHFSRGLDIRSLEKRTARLDGVPAGWSWWVMSSLEREVSGDT